MMADFTLSWAEDEFPAARRYFEALEAAHAAAPGVPGAPTPVPTPTPAPAPPVTDTNVPPGAIRIWEAELNSTVQIPTGAPIPQGNAWVAGDQDGMGYSHFEGDDLVCQLSNLLGRKAGSRNFPTHSGRWDLVSVPPPGMTLL